MKVCTCIFLEWFIYVFLSLWQAFYFPIDPRLNFFVANKLLKELAVSECVMCVCCQTAGDKHALMLIHISSILYSLNVL